MAPAALQGSYVRNGYPLKASKREAALETRFPLRVVEDDHVDRPGVEAQQCVKLTGTNHSIGLIVLITHVRL